MSNGCNIVGSIPESVGNVKRNAVFLIFLRKDVYNCVHIPIDVFSLNGTCF